MKKVVFIEWYRGEYGATACIRTFEDGTTDITTSNVLNPYFNKYKNVKGARIALKQLLWNPKKYKEYTKEQIESFNF